MTESILTLHNAHTISIINCTLKELLEELKKGNWGREREL
jgi:hypothetical protein